MGRRMKDITGLNPNGSKLTARKFSHRIGEKGKYRYFWECLCFCGKVKVAESSQFKNGNVRSCGCLPTSRDQGGNERRKEVMDLILECGSQAAAARRLGISRQRIFQIVKGKNDVKGDAGRVGGKDEG